PGRHPRPEGDGRRRGVHPGHDHLRDHPVGAGAPGRPLILGSGARGVGPVPYLPTSPHTQRAKAKRLVDLFEYQARDMFEKHGVPVLAGATADTPEEARAAAERVGADAGGVTVVKAQVKTGGRGKAGGVKVARSAEEAEQHAAAILRSEEHTSELQSRENL